MFQCRRCEREQEIVSVWMSRHDGRVVPGWGGELGAKHESWKHFVKVWSVKGKPSILNTPALTHPPCPALSNKAGEEAGIWGKPHKLWTLKIAAFEYFDTVTEHFSVRFAKLHVMPEWGVESKSRKGGERRTLGRVTLSVTLCHALSEPCHAGHCHHVTNSFFHTHTILYRAKLLLLYMRMQMHMQYAVMQYIQNCISFTIFPKQCHGDKS